MNEWTFGDKDGGIRQRVYQKAASIVKDSKIK